MLLRLPDAQIWRQSSSPARSGGRGSSVRSIPSPPSIFFRMRLAVGTTTPIFVHHVFCSPYRGRTTGRTSVQRRRRGLSSLNWSPQWQQLPTPSQSTTDTPHHAPPSPRPFPAPSSSSGSTDAFAMLTIRPARRSAARVRSLPGSPSAISTPRSHPTNGRRSPRRSGPISPPHSHR